MAGGVGSIWSRIARVPAQGKRCSTSIGKGRVVRFEMPRGESHSGVVLRLEVVSFRYLW